ncbi:MAG: ABC transporter permease [Pseudomonadota bacterium]
MRAALAFAAAELAIARRNRLVLAAVAIMVLFAGALTLLGSGATGALGVDLLTAAGASLATLSVYVVPLIALLLSFDAIAGEIERGTLGLTLSYPAPRLGIIAGKLLAHLAALALALGLGYATAVGVALAAGSVSGESLMILLRLWAAGMLLGAAFLGIGYALSARARAPGAAAGYAIGAWLVFVVLYDVALLAGLLADGGSGAFTTQVFPWLLVANPADAFRLVTLPEGRAAELASGVAAAGEAVGAEALVSLFVWPALALALAWISFRKIDP